MGKSKLQERDYFLSVCCACSLDSTMAVVEQFPEGPIICMIRSYIQTIYAASESNEWKSPGVEEHNTHICFAYYPKDMWAE